MIDCEGTGCGMGCSAGVRGASTEEVAFGLRPEAAMHGPPVRALQQEELQGDSMCKDRKETSEPRGRVTEEVGGVARGLVTELCRSRKELGFWTV